MLFTLYGDYAYPQGADLWLGSLVELAGALGVSEVAVRSAVARLAREGWLEARRAGNRSYYGLAMAGRRLIEEGTRRIYVPRGAWSGRWCLLTYSIPESKRAHRDRIRKRLAWLGFGSIGGGTYVSPRDVASEAQALAAEHGVGEFARVFSAALVAPQQNATLAAQCWDLPGIAARYRAFIEHYSPLFSRDRRRHRDGSLPDRDAFAVRFALTHDFRRFPFIDPDLPTSLLPKNWTGARARDLFRRYHDLLERGAVRFFSSVASGARPGSRRRRGRLYARGAPPLRTSRAAGRAGIFRPARRASTPAP